MNETEYKFFNLYIRVIDRKKVIGFYFLISFIYFEMVFFYESERVNF